jgi:hypothetical protein
MIAELGVEHSEPVELLRLPHEPPIVRDDVGETRFEVRQLTGFAAVERDSLAVFAQSDERKTESRPRSAAG